ncbi:MAG: PGF-CTERM sorting domain-containing protein [Halobacteriota archaeon]
MNMKIITSGLIVILLLSGIVDMASADTDTLLEHGEKTIIRVSVPSDLSVNKMFLIEIKPPIESILEIERRTPVAIYSTVNLHSFTDVEQVTSSVELAGDVIGHSADGEYMTDIEFYLELTAGAEPVNLDEMTLTYMDEEGYVELTPMGDKPLEGRGQWNYYIFGEAIQTPTPMPIATPTPIPYYYPPTPTPTPIPYYYPPTPTPTPPPIAMPTPTPVVTPTVTPTVKPTPSPTPYIPAPTPTKTPIGKPQLTISQTTLREEPEVGEDVLITVTISNTGNEIAKNINLREHIPSSVSINFIDGANSAGNLITWNGDLYVGQTYSIMHSFRILEERNRAVPVKVTYEDESGNRYETSAAIYISAKAEEIPAPILIPGFEAVFAIAGLLAVAYLLRKRK